MSVDEAFEQKDNSWAVSLAPHLRTGVTTRKVMLSVILALTPQLIYSVFTFGFNAFLLILLSVCSCVFFEAMTQKAFKKPLQITDLSAVVTGILLAYNLPASAPWWLPIVGGFFAMAIVKEFFGGIGQNFVNPALAARATLMISWPTIMTNYVGPDGMTGATPLQIMKGAEGTLPELKAMLIGNIGGVLGETAKVLLLIGFLYLAIKQILDWRITVVYVATTMLMLFVQGVTGMNLLYHLFGGGLILGACFMATDFVTAPISKSGKIIFAVGCGLLTALIRVRGGMAEGVSYSILIMNCFVPLIDRLTRPRIFGEARK
ncbi:MAG: RnfABCDGE type electron transport complex subunit D [Ezakiella sp.]|nr:RnfABCDGE type electron transport complex subunit D [Ezakiella sp.]MDD7471644.1 RnfABCDGE type electron transport complex subunit D [Bacillota bacterium]MDY3923428.1 RnfABCDGE type electron transport complex subunit D [Ezakiella sp.]